MVTPVKRYPLSMRSRFYQQSTFNRVVPVWRQSVAPGQTVSLDVQCKMVTASFLKQTLSELVVDVAFFYVPYRLLWDGWVDFISSPENGGSVPTSNVPWELMFEGTAAITPVSSFFRRAYKLIFNQFYGQSSTTSWYSSIASDGSVSVYPVRALEQFNGRLQPGPVAPDVSYNVVGNAIPLNEFYREMSKARGERWTALSGDKYVDAMRRLGVDLDWRVQEAPELLMVTSTVVEPAFTAQTAPGTGSNVGRRYSRYVATLRTDGRKAFRFAEHGLVVGVMVARPVVGVYRTPPDALALAPTDYLVGVAEEDFGEVPVKAVGASISGGAPLPFAARHAYLRNGVHLVGAGSEDWFTVVDPVSPQQALFVDHDFGPLVSDELQGDVAAFYASGVATGRVPAAAFPRNILR